MNHSTEPEDRIGERQRTRELLRGVMMIARATGDEAEQVLERVLPETPKRKGPASAGRPVLILRRA